MALAVIASYPLGSSSVVSLRNKLFEESLCPELCTPVSNSLLALVRVSISLRSTLHRTWYVGLPRTPIYLGNPPYFFFVGDTKEQLRLFEEYLSNRADILNFFGLLGGRTLYCICCTAVLSWFGAYCYA